MKFGSYLDRELSSKSIDNKTFVARLNILSDLFENVDEVTFSRWRNGHATPSLKKQLIINMELGNDVVYFFKNITLPTRSTTFDQRIYRIFKKEIGYNAIDYFSSLNPKIKLGSAPSCDMRFVIFRFYELFSIYNKNPELYKIVQSKKTKILFLKETELNIPNSHTAITYFENSLKFKSVIFEEHSYLFHIGYYRKATDFFHLIAYSLIHIYRNVNINDYVYSFVRGKYFMDFLDDINAQVIYSENIDDTGLNDFKLYKFKVLDLLSLSNVALYCQKIERHFVEGNISEVLL